MINAAGWCWDPATHLPGGDEFWIGLDPGGRKWLVKMRGAFYALRERTFARLAERLGIPCQESAFICLPQGSAPREEGLDAEAYQVALGLMDPHRAGPCGEGCPVGHGLVNDLDSVPDAAEMILASGVDGATAWIMADFLADMFGANESSEPFLTSDHKCTLIDNEQHFSVRSTWRGNSVWLVRADDGPSESGEDLLLSLCESVAAISSDELSTLVAVPTDFQVSELWPLQPILECGIEVARRISALGRSELRRVNAKEECS
jgi:hypothetical protein